MKKTISVLIVAVIVCGVSFYGGTIFAKRGITPTAGQDRFQTRTGAADGTMRAGPARTGASFVNGEVVSKDDSSVIIKLQVPLGDQANAETGSKIVFISASTTVSKMAEGSVNDLVPGTGVMVIGQTGSDGSITAQSIQIRHEGAAGFGARIGASGQFGVDTR